MRSKIRRRIVSWKISMKWAEIRDLNFCFQINYFRYIVVVASNFFPMNETVRDREIGQTRRVRNHSSSVQDLRVIRPVFPLPILLLAMQQQEPIESPPHRFLRILNGKFSEWKRMLQPFVSVSLRVSLATMYNIYFVCAVHYNRSRASAIDWCAGIGMLIILTALTYSALFYFHIFRPLCIRYRIDVRLVQLYADRVEPVVRLP